MARSLARVLLALVCVVITQSAAAQSAPAVGQAKWTVNLQQNIRWQQVTPSGMLLFSSDVSLGAIDIETGKVAWQKPELGGQPQDSVRFVENSILMEASGKGVLIVFDPVDGTVVFDSRSLNLTKVVTRRALPQTGTFLVHGQRASGPPVVALYDRLTGEKKWVSEGLFEQTGEKKKGLGGLMQNLQKAAAGGTELAVLQAGPEVIVVHTLLGLRALEAKTGTVRWSATLPTQMAGQPGRHVRLYTSHDDKNRIYVSFDNRLMAYSLADGKALWAKPPQLDGWVRDIVQHKAGIIMLPEAPPPDQATGNVKIVNGVVQTGLTVVRYADGTPVNAKPVRMRGTVTDALDAGDAVALAVDAESRTFVNVLDVATATVRMKKDVKIKGQLAYAELIPAGLLYISRPDASTNAEVNIIVLARGYPRFKDSIESGKPLSSSGYDAAKYYLHYEVEGNTMFVYANRDRKLYAVDRAAGTFKPLSGEIKMQGGESPTGMELRPAGIVLWSAQNVVVLGRDGAIKSQAYHPAPKLPGLLRALYAVDAVRAGLRGAAASAYGEAFAQASRDATDPNAKKITAELSNAFNQGGAQLQAYSGKAAEMATKRFKASLTAPGSVFMLTNSPDGKGNVLLQIDKESTQARSRVDLGKEKEPVYAVDDIAGMLFLQTAPGTLVGYRLGS